MRAGGVPFGTTHWSVIAACTTDSTEAAQEALTQLCRDYWPPLYSFVRRRGHDPQDLVQGYFAQLLRNKAYARTSPNKGRFRTFLLASLKHYIADVWDRERALKRGGDLEFVLLDEELHAAEIFWEPEGARPTLNDEQHFEQRWAAALVMRALMRLEAEVAGGAKEAIFRELKPLLSGGVNLPSQEEIAPNNDSLLSRSRKNSLHREDPI